MVSRRRERGQLVLIAALLVATAVLGAVVLLNAVHSSPDVKAQTDAQGLVSSERAVDGIQQDLRELNESADFYNLTESKVRNITQAYSDQLGTLASTEGAAVPSVTLEKYNKTGQIIFRISYTDPSVTYRGNFTLSRGGP